MPASAARYGTHIADTLPTTDRNETAPAACELAVSEARATAAARGDTKAAIEFICFVAAWAAMKAAARGN
jgi:hypothetical protein